MKSKFGSTPETRNGIRKENEHFPILREIFESTGVDFQQSTPSENKIQKVDYWAQNKTLAFDFKTGENPESGFCLTYKMNNTNKNVFEVGARNITSIFLLEHESRYAFVPKNSIHQWFLENKPKVFPSKKDNSTFFIFPTSAVKELAIKFKAYEEI